MNQIARNNHYVPESYLKRFARDDQVWVYDRTPDHAKIPNPRPAYTKRAGAEVDLYTTSRGGVLSDEFEKWFQQEIEDPGFRALQKLRDATLLDAEDKRALGRYIVAQELRVPLARDGLRRVLSELAADVVRLLHGEMLDRLRSGGQIGGREWSDQEIHAYSEALTRGDLDIPIDADADYWIGEFLPSMLDAWGPRAAAQLWKVLPAPENAEFITSDMPVIKAIPDGELGKWVIAGWQDRGVWVTFPVSPIEMLFCVTDSEVEWNPEAVSKDHCKYLNTRTATFAHRYVYARTPADYILPTFRD